MCQRTTRWCCLCTSSTAALGAHRRDSGTRRWWLCHAPPQPNTSVPWQMTSSGWCLGMVFDEKCPRRAGCFRHFRLVTNKHVCVWGGGVRTTGLLTKQTRARPSCSSKNLSCCNQCMFVHAPPLFFLSLFAFMAVVALLQTFCCRYCHGRHSKHRLGLSH